MNEYMSRYLVLLILDFFFVARLAKLPYGLDSNVTKLQANLLTKPSYFIILPIVFCNLVSIKNVIIIIIIINSLLVSMQTILTLSDPL